MARCLFFFFFFFLDETARILATELPGIHWVIKFSRYFADDLDDSAFFYFFFFFFSKHFSFGGGFSWEGVKVIG